MTLLTRLAATTATLALLAACGTTTVATPTAGASSAPSSQSCADDTTSTSTAPVSMTDGVGRKVELAKPAQRVAVLEWQQTEDVLTLCLTPVAVAEVQVRGVGVGLGAPQRGEQGAWIALQGAGQRRGGVDLVDLAVGDGAQDPGDRGVEHVALRAAGPSDGRGRIAVEGGGVRHKGRLALAPAMRDGREERAVGFDQHPVRWQRGGYVLQFLRVLEGHDP